ncbi:MAG: hypothetical protein QOI47_162 [Actinomycetota bacterium]|nr:hypothetical protein [Actinomycetota bacterium]
MMLSRHAESLFWTGRHVERAGDTARMLDVTYHALLESPHAEAQRTWSELLDVLSLRPAFEATDDHVSARSVTRFLVLDPTNPGAIVSSVGRARENARSIRELLSTELWETINTFWLELMELDLAAGIEHQPYELYRLVKRRTQEIAGTAAETMPHDDGWRFLLLGWMLERAMIVCRLINVRTMRYTSGEDELDFYRAVELLKSASALEAFRKTYPGAMTLHNVVGFLLLSPTFPRSVLYSIRAAEARLGQLVGPGALARPQRVLGRLRADLDFADPIELLNGDLHAALDDLEAHLRGVADLVAVQFFRNVDELSFLHAVEHLG